MKIMNFFRRIIKLTFLIFLSINYNVQAKPLRFKATTDSIHSIEKIILGGVKQTILITGKDTVNNPILLLLHGGPGFSELRFFRSYNAALDSSFTMVNWDQRGTGLSYNKDIPESTMNINQFIEDAHQLITILKKRFHKNKIYLAGHSWGSLLGIHVAQKYPEDIQAYIGIGQVVSMEQNEKLSLAYTIKMAEKENNKQALKELRPLVDHYPSFGKKNLNNLFLERKWLLYFGGVVHGKRNYSSFFDSITAVEHKLYNDSLSNAGELLSMNTLWPTVLKTNLFRSLPELKVSVYFLNGRFDYNTCFELTEKYFQFIKAPHKELIWFEHSAHIMPFEEPLKFNEFMKSLLKK
jgi:pimeloyl-ACP methyl ester carboxylesterase